MSTVVDNDKYIINGSTLSDIGDAVREQTPDQYETVTEDIVCYKDARYAYGDNVTLLTLTEETIQGWYQNTLPSPITGIEIINLGNSGYSSWVVVDGNRKYFTLNKTYTYSLPITIYGMGSSSSGAKFTYEIYPLNGDNYLSWDSNYYYPSSSSDYTAHLYKKEISYERLLPKTNCLVSEIAQKIASLPSLANVQVDFSLVSTRGYSAAPSTNLSTIGVSDISDIYFIIGYESYDSYNSGLVFLDLVHNPNPVGTTTLGNEVCPTYKVYRIPKNNSNYSNAYEAYTSEPSVYKTIAYSKQQNMLYNPSSSTWGGLTRNNNNYTEYMMVIHKPASSS